MLFYKAGKSTVHFLPKQRIQFSSAWAMVEEIYLVLQEKHLASSRRQILKFLARKGMLKGCRRRGNNVEIYEKKPCGIMRLGLNGTFSEYSKGSRKGIVDSTV
jgi:hypothetical protein